MFGLRESRPHGRVIALAFTLLATAACGDKEETDGTDANAAPVLVPDTGTGSTTTVDAGSQPSASNDAGAPPVRNMDSGAANPPPAVDAAPPAASGDTGVASADASVDAGGGTPLALPSPDMPGPYEVTMVENTGMGFENPPTAANDRGDGLGCMGFIQIFGETAEAARDYALFGPNYKVELYTLYYPKNMVPGQLYPVLSWANGTCAKTNGYHAMLNHIASHGFIVIATNSRYTANGRFQMRGVDFVFAENARAESPLFGRVNKEQVGVFGHSQGGGSTGAASADPRVKTSVLMHGGSGGQLHAPAFFLTGEMDNPTGVRSAYDGSRVPAAFGNLKMSDHITMMKEYKRMAPEVAAWFRYQLLKDEPAKKWFVGADCVLCKDPEWVYTQKNLM
jgi:hypothetical protein